MRKKVLEMNNELDKLTNMQMQVEKQINSASDSIDENSIYVGQVDYEATPDELRGNNPLFATIMESDFCLSYWITIFFENHSTFLSLWHNKQNNDHGR